MPRKYPYDFEYQVDILKVAVQDPAFLVHNPEVFQPQFFSLDHLMMVAQMVRAYYDKHREVPGYPALKHEASVYYAQFRVKDVVQIPVNDIIERVFREHPRNKVGVVNTIQDFARRQSISTGVREVLDLLEEGGEMDRVLEIMRSSTAVGTRQRTGWSFFQEIGNLRTRLQEDKDYNPANKINTGLRRIDRNTFGGIGPGQIWTVGAKPKGGKTTLMCNIGASAIYQGRKVYHYSFGDMNKTDVMVKYAQIFSNMTVEQLLQGGGAELRFQQIIDACPGAHLEIIYESPGVMGIEDLYADVGLRMARTGVKPDMIVIDYANKMKQPIPESSYRSMSRIYEGLKELGDSFNAGILTGVQLRRSAHGQKKQENEVGTEEDVAESWLQVADCDALILINQTAMQDEQHKATLTMPIVRRGKSITASGNDRYEVFFYKDKARFKDV